MPHCPWEQAPSKVAGGRMAACIDQRRYSQAILCSTLSSVTGEGDPTLSGGPRKVTGGRMAACCCLPSLTLGRKDQAQARAEENPAGMRWHKEFVKYIGYGANCVMLKDSMKLQQNWCWYFVCVSTPPTLAPTAQAMTHHARESKYSVKTASTHLGPWSAWKSLSTFHKDVFVV